MEICTQTHTVGTPHEDEGRDWGGATEAKQDQRWPADLRSQAGDLGTVSLTSSKGTSPAHTMILNF